MSAAAEKLDPLEGFRGDTPLTPDQQAEHALRDRLGENEHLVDLFQMGLAMERFVSTNPAGQHLVARAEQQLAESTQAMFSQADTQSPTFKTAHFNGRVALTVLQFIKQAIESGKEAEHSIRDNEPETQS